MANPIEKPTLVGTLNKLKDEGFTHDFNIHNNQLKSGDITLSPKEFEIVKVYRFEGASDPDDNSVLYAIKSLHHDVKGTLINAYGMYADDNADDLLRQLDTPVPE
ncbi:MAG: phosphoribosylpyrophosphate synthetase [Bacteroidota bacterium]